MVFRRFNKLMYMIQNPATISLRLRNGSVETHELLNQPWVKDLNISTVLDIGANSGQFALSFNSVNPKAMIYSFEPIPQCFQALKKNIANIEGMAAFNVGLGDFTGELDFEVNTHSMSSSFLKMTETHKSAFPETLSSTVTKLKVEKLDSFIEKIEVVKPLLIKLDVQGFEEQVIKGGENMISLASIIIIETSFKILYEKQPLFDDIYFLLKKHGFIYAGSFDQLKDPLTGATLQEDSIFIRSQEY
jgi:FkbM family methyltransferase